MDDEALDIAERQGLLDGDLSVSSWIDDIEEEDEDEEIEEFGDDTGGDPDIVEEQVQQEFDALLQAVEEAKEVYEAAGEEYESVRDLVDVLLNAALEKYTEVGDHYRSVQEELMTWMDENMQEGDIPVWVGEFEE